LLEGHLKESWSQDTANSACFAATPKKKVNHMKKLLALITVIAVSSSPVFAGCGKTVTNEGTLKSFDAATKTLVVAGKDGKEAKITLTPTTKGADAVAGMVGKSVKVDHEHNKATSVAAGS
jgi:predicted S18 family serine protease